MVVLVLDARKLCGAAVLAPALRGAVLVDDQRGVGAARADPALLPGTVLRRVRPGHLGVAGHAPASAVNPVVALGELANAAHADPSSGRIVYRIAGPPMVSAALPAQDSSAARARRRARSAGALIIGQ